MIQYTNNKADIIFFLFILSSFEIFLRKIIKLPNKVKGNMTDVQTQDVVRKPMRKLSNNEDILN